MTFGLNWTISIPAPALALRSADANILCRRETTSPETDKTTTRTNGIHTFFSAGPTGMAFTRTPSADRLIASLHHQDSLRSRRADGGPEERPARRATTRIPLRASAFPSTPSGVPDGFACGRRAASDRAR